jgi:hypothetical protein
MSVQQRSRLARVLAVISPGDGPHLVAPGGVPVREWTRPTCPSDGLDGALASCLARLPDDSESFERAALGWHARWCARLPALTLAEAHSGLDALKAFQGVDAIGGALELRRLCVRHGLWDVAEILRRWIVQLETSRLPDLSPRER